MHVLEYGTLLQFYGLKGTKKKQLRGSLGVHYSKDFTKDGKPMQYGTVFYWLATAFCLTCQQNPTPALEEMAGTGLPVVNV